MADAQSFFQVSPARVVGLGRDFTSTDAFRSLFRDGMALVEEAAAYLDGPGRDEARRLPRLSALAYADESMRLTTRMMQIASWLLVRRAVAEGEMSKEKAALQISRLRLIKNEAASHNNDTTILPPRLIDLIDHSLSLQDRVLHAETLMHSTSDEASPRASRNAVALQHMLIQSAFARETTHH